LLEALCGPSWYWGSGILSQKSVQKVKRGLKSGSYNNCSANL
jgi:hypothetical protein